MNKAVKSKASRSVCALVIFALILGVIFSVGSFGIFARADEEEDIDYTFTQTAMHPSNNQFATPSGTALASPDSWTGARLGESDGSGSDGVTAGILNLDTYATNADKYNLRKYWPNEFPNTSFSPDSPFGDVTTDPDTNRNVLLINVGGDSQPASTAYGYTSSNLTFTANRYYMVKVWVRTGKFAPGSGAAIRLNGLGEDVAFTEINTVANIEFKPENNYGYGAEKHGWAEYTFYIGSSSYADQTVTISLQVGDAYTDADDSANNYFHPAKGYALFDNIQAYEISPATFYGVKKQADETQSGTTNTIIRDLSGKTSAKFSHLNNLDFTDSAVSGWEFVSAETDNAAQYPKGIYNSNTFVEDNYLHLNAEPLSSFGKPSADLNADTSILVLSSYYGGDFQSVALGVRTAKTFTVERYRYYRVAAWVKTEQISDGSGATLAIGAKRGNSDLYKDDSIFATITSCTGDTANKARGGFKQYAFYIKGSALRDYEADIECWLGTPGSPSRGIAMFDNVTVEEITPAVYNANSSNGTVVDFDTYAGVNGNTFITFPDTGITNGSFYEIAEYKNFRYPLAPASWTMYTPDTAGTLGYATDAVDTDGIVSGIIPTDSATFEQYRNDFGGVAINPRPRDGSILMLYSSKPTAYCYRSSDFTVTADTPATLTVRLATADMSVSDYGASLVLKNDTQVLATIEGIRTNGSFTDYRFHIEPASTDITTLHVEIWLGNSHRGSIGNAKRSAGRIYVESVAFANMEDEKDGDTVTKSMAVQFAEKLTAYNNDRHANLSQIFDAAYSFKNIDFAAYDSYDKSFVKYPYNWQLSVDGGETDGVRYGIFDPSGAGRDATVPAYFVGPKSGGNVLLLANLNPAASTVSYNGSVSLNADTYYKIDVLLKVDIAKEQERSEAVGAKLALSGTKFAFRDITDTSEKSDSITDTEAFQTYTFYIKTGSEATSSTLSLSLGEAAYAKQCSGRAYIGSVTYTDITAVAYDEAAAGINDGTLTRALLADLSTADDETDEEPAEPTDNTLSWWLIPSILFAVAILIALIGFLIRKIMEKRADKKGVVQKAASYDRNATLNVEHNKNAADGEKVAASDGTAADESYTAFDEDNATVAEKPATEDAPAESEEKQTETAEQTTEEAPTATEENADSTTAEETVATETPEPTKEETPKQDSFIDRFDD